LGGYRGYFTGPGTRPKLRAMSAIRIVLHFGKAEAKRRPATVPLAAAVLCVDCETLSDARGHACPACGGQALMSVAAVLGGALAEEVRARQIDEPNIDAVVRRLVESVLQD
jgi:hypothetical protein